MENDLPIPFLTDASGQAHQLLADTTTIGRALDCDIIITSKRVSRMHAQLRRDSWRVILEDLGSANGTFLNEERLSEARELKDKDRITLGGVSLIFHDPDSTSFDSPFPLLELDLAAGEVRVDRQLVQLSPKAFQLLAYLYQNIGQVCSKAAIAQAVWPDYQDGVYDYQIENLVRRLRKGLEPDPANPKLLLTVRGLGYKLVRSG